MKLAMKIIATLVIALWQIEMAVECGIATARRPANARQRPLPPVTPPDSRQKPVKCENGKCTPPKVQWHPPTIIR